MCFFYYYATPSKKKKKKKKKEEKKKKERCSGGWETKLCPVVRFQFWSFRACWVSPSLLLLPSGSTCVDPLKGSNKSVWKLVVLNKNTGYHNSANGGARSVMVIAVGNGHGDMSSNPGWDWLHFHITLIPLGKVWIQLFSLQLWVNSRADWFLQPWGGN